ncbi:hypothetical protein [Epilithonimonas zeae]|uniref:AbiTii domain-containing protein n=1 Tax=Epilithonimonas zeae TaxID=1416779 RepID=UPI00200E1F9E|nr:hypothetical protein [Epilithonimonas zeae]UQB67588.1 hypothetical protein KI430_11105 [Epilithonimonas zeae]
MKTTFPLQEVIEDIINTEKSLSSALIRLNYFGRLINNEELINFTNNELNGYGAKDDVPIYRRTVGTLRVTLQAYTEKYFKVLPISMLKKPYDEMFRFVKIKEGIAAIEKLGKELFNEKTSGELATTFPLEFLHILQEPARKIFKSNVKIDVIEASLCANSNIIVEIPNAIRIKLLEFVMNIAGEFGYSVEIDTFNKSPEINNQTINTYMNTTINNNGDGNLINNGDNNQIDNKTQLVKGDLTQLKEELRKYGIEEADIQEISSIIVEETADFENNRLGTRANGWISNILNKSLNGVGKISTAVTANLLASLLKSSIGMP